MRNKIIFIGSLFLLIAVAVFGVKEIKAQNSGNSAYPTIVQKIAEKFGLAPSDVNSVFTDVQEQKKEQFQNQQQARMEKLLDDEVSAGQITDAQKQAILAKMNELQTQRQQERTDLENWAKDNGLDLKTLRFGKPFFGFGRGFFR